MLFLLAVALGCAALGWLRDLSGEIFTAATVVACLYHLIF
jgi:hypothetical protein